MKRSTSLACLMFSGWCVLAAPLYEPFDYDPAGANTNLIGQTSPEGVTWMQAGPDSGLTNQPTIATNNLDYAGLPPSMGHSARFGGNGTSARFSFGYTANSETIYYSFVLRVNNITGMSTSGIFWAGFNNSSGSQTSTPTVAATRVYTKADPANPDVFYLGTTKQAGSATGWVFDPNPYGLGTNIFIVGSYTFNPGTGDDESRMWINPPTNTFSASSPPVETLYYADGNDISGNVIRSFVLFNRSAGEPAEGIIDELSIGSTWADVTPPADKLDITAQPQSQRVLVGGTATLRVSTFRATAWQWQRDGTNLIGATDRTLAISNAQLGDSGTYRVIASNAATSKTSNGATLAVLPDVYPRLAPLWTVPPGSRPYVTVDASNTPNLRDLAYYAPSNHLYVLSRTNSATGSTNAEIYVLDATTGAQVDQLNTDPTVIYGGQTAGALHLVSMDVADDGAVYACNVSTTETFPDAFKLYRWSSGVTSAVPVKLYEGSPVSTFAAARWGDTLAARGTGTGTEIVLDSSDGNWGAVFKPADGSLTAFIPSWFTNRYGPGSIGRSLKFGTGQTLWQKRLGAGLMLASYDLITGAGQVITNHTNFGSALGPVGFDLTTNLLAGIEFASSSNTPDTLNLYEVSDLSAPLLLAKYAFPTNHQANANAIGEVIWAGDKVFALDANNGLAVFTLVPFTPTPSLTITASEGSAVISWPANAAGFTLQATPALTPAITWTNVGTGTIVGGAYQVSEALGGGSKFYRLLRP